MSHNVFVLGTLFIIVVMPIWLILHYVHKGRMAKNLERNDVNDLEAMLASVDKLADRVATLEKILDADNPNWRTPEK